MQIPRVPSFRLRKQPLAVGLAVGLAAAMAIPTSANAVPAAITQHYTGTLADGATWVADVPANYNGTILLFSHGYGPLTAETQPSYAGDALLNEGYAVVGSSYSGITDWALASAVRDQFGALTALEKVIGKAKQTYAIGESMGGLVSSLANERNSGQLDGVLTTCGLVAGGVNLNNYEVDGMYALSELLEPEAGVRLANFADPADAKAAAADLAAIAQQHSGTAQGRARIVLAAALLNMPTWVAGNPKPAAQDYAAQQAQQVQLLGGGLFDFLITARQQLEVAAGGNSAFTAGVKYESRLKNSGYLNEVKAAYQTAGLDLAHDLATLTRNADISPDPGTITRLKATSHLSGRLTVPQINIHTIADELVPVQHENWYAQRVATAGRSSLLRQAYTNTAGHCNFTSGELIVALNALIHRVRSGSWGTTTKPAALNAAAVAGGHGPTAFVTYQPTPLGGARTNPPVRWVGSRSEHATP